MEFNYEKAFSRTIGWVTPDELQKLRRSKIAIAGMGGVGGIHLVTLSRLGIGSFHIADFDTFDLHNFNRQAGAFMNTIGRPKIDVMEEQAKQINPEMNITKFPMGVTDENMDQFLAGVDVYVDGLDFYEIDIRRRVFMACYKKNIPVVTVGPVGMGGALLNFLPGKMSFDDYFGLEGKPFEEKIARFIIGLTPSFVHMKGLVQKTAFSSTNKTASSTPMGCAMAAGILGTEVLKLILKRGKTYAVPWAIHYDGYTNKLKKNYTWGGHRNPIFWIKLQILKKIFSKS